MYLIKVASFWLATALFWCGCLCETEMRSGNTGVVGPAPVQVFEEIDITVDFMDIVVEALLVLELIENEHEEAVAIAEEVEDLLEMYCTSGTGDEKDVEAMATRVAELLVKEAAKELAITIDEITETHHLVIVGHARDAIVRHVRRSRNLGVYAVARAVADIFADTPLDTLSRRGKKRETATAVAQKLIPELSVDDYVKSLWFNAEVAGAEFQVYCAAVSRISAIVKRGGARCNLVAPNPFKDVYMNLDKMYELKTNFQPSSGTDLG